LEDKLLITQEKNLDLYMPIQQRRRIFYFAFSADPGGLSGMADGGNRTESASQFLPSAAQARSKGSIE